MKRMQADAERSKYERIWTHPEYRRQAPGEGLVDGAIKALGMVPGESVIDFGCGTGRPAQRLRMAGLEVTGIDFAFNCLDPDVSIPFVVANLWSLPRLSADWGYCTDVMEHIPPDRVDDVLRNIRASVRKGVYFQIATRADVMGKLVGEKLHLTVEPTTWWSDALARYWDEVETIEGTGWMQAIVR